MGHVDCEYASQEFCPSYAALFLGHGSGFGCCNDWGLFRSLLFFGHDGGTNLGMRGEAAEESCQMNSRWGHKCCELFDKLQS